MEHYAADAIKRERDSYVKAALKNHVPWPEIVESYGVTLKEIMVLEGMIEPGEKRGTSMIWKPGDQKGGE